MATYNQTSFSGGMNLFVDDTRLNDSEYREAFNLRNRFDVLDPIRGSTSVPAPSGQKQGLFAFGDFLLLFVAGQAYYRFRGNVAWQQIGGFLMSSIAPRVYLCAVPVSTALFVRHQTGASLTSPVDVVNLVSNGTPSGIVVQDGINQPWFIWIDVNGNVQARVIQKYSDWDYSLVPGTTDNFHDAREYVPIGTFMEWYDGILFVVSPDGNLLYRSVTGRPLDFVIIIDQTGQKAGDASVTAYSVGVGGITALRTLNTDGLFVAAANRVAFIIKTNRSPNAVSICGEPTFIRQYAFNAGCVNEKTIVDILGDLAFVDPEGLRSFNAVLQQQNEGRNSIFSLKVAALFKGILQDDLNSCAIVFDNYALFGVDTVYGFVIVVYDTLNQVFVSIDQLTGGVAIRQFAKIDTDVIELYCITADDRVIKLYDNNADFVDSSVRLRSLCSQNPSLEMQPTSCRVVLNNFRENSTVTQQMFVNNRQSVEDIMKTIKFVPSPNPFTDRFYTDVDSQVANLLFNWTNANQGWKCFILMSWTGGGSITNVQTQVQDITPKNPLLSQGNG